MHRPSRVSLSSCVLALLAAGCGAGTRGPDGPAPPPQTSRVIVISIDSMMPEAYTNPDAHGLKVPTLRALVKRGAFARGVDGVFPTITYPSHTTLITGVPPKLHGIVSNRPIDLLDKNYEGWRWYTEQIAVPTLWQAVEAQHRPAALITWPVTVGAQATFVVPEYWRAGTKDDQALLRALSTRGLLAKVEKASPELWQKLVPPDVFDEAQFAIVKYLVTQERVDLVLMHAWRLDDMQHEHGPWSPEGLAAIENADKLLGELLATLEKTPEWSHTTLVIVSDHGMAPQVNEIRLNALFVQRGWITLDAEGKTTAAKVATIQNGGSAFVYVLDPSLTAEVRAALEGVGAPIAKIYSPAELAELGADPAATFAVSASANHAFSDKRTGQVVSASDAKHRGNHGFPPADPVMRSSFIAVGPNVQPRDLGIIRMIDIAPTLARWLGVPLPSATGVPISGL